MKKLSIGLSMLVVGGTLALTVPLINAQQSTNAMPRVTEKMPRMHAAIQDLQQAKIKLAAAPDIFGSHKAAAIKAVDEAILEVKAGILFAEEKEKQH